MLRLVLLLLLLLPVVCLLRGHVLPLLLGLLVEGLSVPLLLLRPWHKLLLKLLPLLMVTWWRDEWLLMPPPARILVRLLLLLVVRIRLHMLLLMWIML
jgi:hypothetical protein